MRIELAAVVAHGSDMVIKLKNKNVRIALRIIERLCERDDLVQVIVALTGLLLAASVFVCSLGHVLSL